MDGWILELIKGLSLITFAVLLHRLIRGLGKTYVTDIFRFTPQIGKNFLVLADISFYLIFAAYTLLWVKLVRPSDWAAEVNSSQLEQFVFSFAWISLIIGVLHGMNVWVLPFVGTVTALRERFGKGPPEV